MKQIVVIGGGTGTAVVLSGLKSNKKYQLSAIISTADSGGSTGRLRDEFGFIPVGDMRQALAALAKNQGQTWIRDLLLYRFNKGSGLEGHNLGNLILTALQDMTGSTTTAIEIAAKIFRLQGSIYPATTSVVDLVIEYDDGTFVIGEHHLNPGKSGGKHIKKVRLSPRASLYAPAKASLAKADAVIIGPGDVYASIMPALIVSGMKTVLQTLTCPIIYIVNLMTSYTQTSGFSAMDHVNSVENAINRPVTHILINNAPIPKTIKTAYLKQHDLPVVDDGHSDPRIWRAPLITTTQVKPTAHDPLIRSFLRHDPKKIVNLIKQII